MKPLSPVSLLVGQPDGTKPPANGSGRIGLMVYDKELGRVIALTAKQTIAGVLRVGDGTAGFGSTLHNSVFEADLSDYVSADAMIGLVQLDLTAPISIDLLHLEEEELAHPTAWVENPASELGSEVVIHTSATHASLAKVLSTSGHFIMETDTNGRTSHFRDAVVLKGIQDSRPVGQGDAGALVTTSDGKALAIVIGGDGERIFAAPVHRVLDRIGGIVGLDETLLERLSGGFALYSEDLLTLLPHSASNVDYQKLAQDALKDDEGAALGTAEQLIGAFGSV